MAHESASDAVEVRLPCRAPCDIDGLVRFFARRAVPGVEQIDGDVYYRSISLERGNGVVALRAGADDVEAKLWLDSADDLDAAVTACRQLLDLDTDPAPIVEALGRDELIGAIVRAAPGRRVPGVVEPNELSIRAVLGQQVSLAGAATLAGRLVAAYGDRLTSPVGAVTHVFPSAAALARADPDQLAMPWSRRRALIGLATALADGEVVFDTNLMAHDEIERRLLALPGIGPWTVAYVAMRALGDPDAFMPADLGVRHGLERLGCDGRPPSAVRIAERWRPYRAYATQHLWAHVAPPTRREPHAAATGAVSNTQ
ncbi:MAG: DNA-3-methyladenine glycosylase 2 family protein [Solirubrobacterales bacterium]|nr:DNA-3-methyladenine glycosylase 2 family protein [Solirubrobacterales bacterium]